MSMRVSGWAIRSFIIGIRLCPPARIRASGPYLASRRSACATLDAFSYSTCAGTCMRPSSRSRLREQFTRANAGGPRGDNGMVMTLTQLNAFVLVARLGSVTAAANALGVSEPAVSQALSALRQHLGDQLVTRGPAGMTLTAGGSRLLSSASQIVVLGAEAHAAVRAAQGAPEQLRVVATSSIAEFVVSPLMEAFTRRYAGSVEVSSGVAVTAEMGVLVSNRLADVALGSSPGSDPALAVVTEPMFRYRIVVVTAGQPAPLRSSPRQWRGPVEPPRAQPGSGTRPPPAPPGTPRGDIRRVPHPARGLGGRARGGGRRARRRAPGRPAGAPRRARPGGPAGTGDGGHLVRHRAGAPAAQHRGQRAAPVPVHPGGHAPDAVAD